MRGTLAKRLTYRIMAVVLVMIAVITSIVYFTVREYMLQEAQERYEGILQRDHEEFRRRLSDVMVAANNHLHTFELYVDTPDSIIPQQKRVLQVNSSVLTCGLVYAPGYFPGRARCLEIYASHDSAGVVHTGVKEDEYNVVMEKEWFKKGLSRDSSDWSEVYFEYDLIPGISGRRQVTTYFVPVHNKQGKVAALLGCDLSLEYLRSMLMDDMEEMNAKFETGSRRHSYSFVIDHKGTYIIHPDEKRMLNSNIHEVARFINTYSDDNLVDRIMRKEKGSEMVEIEGVPSWIYYRKVKHMDWVIGIVVPKEVISSKGRMLNSIILAVMFLGILAIYFICRKMILDAIRPLHSFALSADEVAKGNFTSALPDVKSSDELKMLHDSFEVMQASLSLYVDKVRRTSAEKAAIDNEMSNARDIQMTMVPSRFPPFPERDDIDIFGMMEPAKSVGGDLFDYLLRDNHLFFCIGDVSGKGMPAALLMAVMKTMFRGEARRNDKAETIVNSMNRNLCAENTEGYFVTMFIGILDLATGHLDYCNAGHEAPLVSGQPLPIKRNKPVGVLSDWNFEGQEVQLQPGDTLFLYTDGLSEARNQTGKRLGRAYVVQLVNQQHYDTAKQLVELMAQEVHRYAADTEQSDDITLLAITWDSHAPCPLILQATMDEIDRLKPFVTDAASQAGIDAKETKRLRAAVEEAVANIINYGQATTITLKAEKTAGQLIITIDDDGLPFDPTQESPTDLSVPTDQRPPGGMGILMIQRMTDRQTYQRVDERNILTLFKNI